LPTNFSDEAISGAHRYRLESAVADLKNLVLSRRVLMFPQAVLDIIFTFIVNGSFLAETTDIRDPAIPVQPHVPRVYIRNDGGVMTRWLVGAVVCSLGLSLTALGQTIDVVDDAKLPRFEVASIRPGDPHATGARVGSPPGRFV
jgi:hypothetical protein